MPDTEITPAAPPLKQAPRKVYTMEDEELKGITPLAEMRKRGTMNWSWTLHRQVKTQNFSVGGASEDAVAWLRRETAWSPLESDEDFYGKSMKDGKPTFFFHFINEEGVDQLFTLSVAVEIGTGVRECPFCKGTLMVRRLYEGFVTGLTVSMPVDCKCSCFRRFFSRWYNSAIVPRTYRGISMDTLSNYSAAFKGHMLENLQEWMRLYPHSCALLTGPAGSGKSTVMIAMYHEALGKWVIDSLYNSGSTEQVWKINALTLSKQLREWELRDMSDDPNGKLTPYPEVMESKVLAAVRNNLVPFLFLDELEKIKLDSDFQRREFLLIVDSIQANGGRIVASTNLNVVRLLGALGEQFGPALLRRLCGPRWNQDGDKPAGPMTGGALIDFYANKIFNNFESGAILFDGGKPGVPASTPALRPNSSTVFTSNKPNVDPDKGEIEEHGSKVQTLSEDRFRARVNEVQLGKRDYRQAKGGNVILV